MYLCVIIIVTHHPEININGYKSQISTSRRIREGRQNRKASIINLNWREVFDHGETYVTVLTGQFGSDRCGYSPQSWATTKSSLEVYYAEAEMYSQHP